MEKKTIISPKKQLEELENFISDKTRILPTYSRYAFYVVLSEETYKTLRDLYKRTDFYGSPNLFPLCHIKLLTETYVREFQDIDDKKVESTIAKELYGENQIKIDFWNQVIDLLSKVDLTIIGTEGWKYCKNVIAHAGVPESYFKNLFNKINNVYTYYGRNKDVALDKLILESNSFENFRFSRFFKEVFNEESEKRTLFKWFLNLIEISEKYDIGKFDLGDKIPPHLLQAYRSYNLNNNIGDRLKRFREKKLKSKFIFNNESGLPEYIIKLPVIIDTPKKIKISSPTFEVPEHWKRVTEKIKPMEISTIIFPVYPKDLLFSFIFQYSEFDLNTKVFNFNNYYSKPTKLLIFDENLEIILPLKREIFVKDNITLISKVELPEIKNLPNCHEIDDLSDRWYGWYHYQIDNVSNSKNIKLGSLPEPYHYSSILFDQNYYVGQWISEHEICKKHNTLFFGGDNIPSFKISSNMKACSVNKPIIIGYLISNKEVLEDNNGSLRIENDCWIWESSKTPGELKSHKYIIIINAIFDTSLELIEFKECIWYPGIKINIEPNRLLLDNESCSLRIFGRNELTYKTDEISVNPILEGNNICWNFDRKPEYSSPTIFLYNKGEIIDFNPKLPYLSIWLQNEKVLKNSLPGWSIDEPFSKSFLNDLYQDDSNTRLRFYYHGNEPEKLMIIDKNNKVIQNLDFSVIYKVFSINCGELLRYEEPVIYYPREGKKIPLLKDDSNFWNFEMINRKMKREKLYKGIFCNI